MKKNNNKILREINIKRPPKSVIDAHQIHKIEQYQGPIPHPSILIKYNEAHPKAAEIILGIFQMQTEHRIKMETIVCTGNNRRSYLGQVFAFIIAMTIIIIGGLLIYTEKNIEGFSLIITAIASLIGIFLYGKHEQKEKIRKMGNEIHK